MTKELNKIEELNKLGKAGAALLDLKKQMNEDIDNGDSGLQLQYDFLLVSVALNEIDKKIKRLVISEAKELVNDVLTTVEEHNMEEDINEK